MLCIYCVRNILLIIYLSWPAKPYTLEAHREGRQVRGQALTQGCAVREQTHTAKSLGPGPWNNQAGTKNKSPPKIKKIKIQKICKTTGKKNRKHSPCLCSRKLPLRWIPVDDSGWFNRRILEQAQKCTTRPTPRKMNM